VILEYILFFLGHVHGAGSVGVIESSQELMDHTSGVISARMMGSNIYWIESTLYMTQGLSDMMGWRAVAGFRWPL
jgi:hypothetical protein